MNKDLEIRIENTNCLIHILGMVDLIEPDNFISSESILKLRELVENQIDKCKTWKENRVVNKTLESTNENILKTREHLECLEKLRDVLTNDDYDKYHSAIIDKLCLLLSIHFRLVKY